MKIPVPVNMDDHEVVKEDLKEPAVLKTQIF
jgi:hypothetical protein